MKSCTFTSGVLICMLKKLFLFLSMLKTVTAVVENCITAFIVRILWWREILTEQDLTEMESVHDIINYKQFICHVMEWLSRIALLSARCYTLSMWLFILGREFNQCEGQEREKADEGNKNRKQEGKKLLNTIEQELLK